MIDVARIHAASPAPLVAAQRLGLEIHRSARADRVLVLCPWHAERTPSCSIATKDGRIVAHCYACGAGGDLLELVAAVNALDARVDFRRVAELAAELVGVRLGGAARMSRQRPVDPRVELAHRIDVHADRWLRGLPVNHDEVVEAARPRELIEAVRVLAELDVDGAEEAERRDRELDAMAETVLARIAEREAAWFSQ